MATIFGTKSAITRVVQEISLRGLGLTEGFRGRAINDVNQILQRPTLVTMETKIETKQTKQTPLV